VKRRLHIYEQLNDGGMVTEFVISRFSSVTVTELGRELFTYLLLKLVLYLDTWLLSILLFFLLGRTLRTDIVRFGNPAFYGHRIAVAGFISLDKD